MGGRREIITAASGPYKAGIINLNAIFVRLKQFNPIVNLIRIAVAGISNNKKSVLFAAGAVLCWSTVATAFKIALARLSVPELLCIASNTALVVLAVAMAVSGKFRLLKEVGPRGWLRCAALGLLNPVVYYLVLFTAYDMLPAKIAQPLNFTWPLVFMLLNSVLYKVKVRGRQVVFMAVSFAGVYILASGDGGGEAFSGWGIFFALLSAFVWAFYWIANSRNKTDGMVSLFISFLTAALLLNITAPFYFSAGLSAEALLSGAYVGVFEMGLPFILWLYALKTADNLSTVNQLSFLSPILSLFFIAMVLGEQLTVYTFAGVALVVGGIWLNQRYSSRTARQ